MIKTDFSGIDGFSLSPQFDKAEKACRDVADPGGIYADYNGWVGLPDTISENLLTKITDTAQEINRQSQVVVILGAGGSYLGAKAAIDFLHSPNYNLIRKNTPIIFFAGDNLSAEYLQQIMNFVIARDFSVLAISKSGRTLETSVAFRTFQSLLKAKYGAGADGRIYIITDRNRGAFRKYADENGCTSFEVPENIGGRYSVLTPVGLLPMAISGIDIRGVIAGASDERKNGRARAIEYAAYRQALYSEGKKLEFLCAFEHNCRYFGEWWRQLFAESEGKNGRGIFPVFGDYTSDLHSIGQYIQQGERSMFETFLCFEEGRSHLLVPECDIDDGYDRLAGIDFNIMNKAVAAGIADAHISGSVPVIKLVLPRISPEALGALFYFFELSCGISAHMSGVNPFDQPGVEAYKKNFFPFLEKLI